jgi:hypothetical protein
VKIKIKNGKIGLYGLSIDFGKTISYPFPLRTVDIGTGIQILEVANFTKNAKGESFTHSCLNTGFSGKILGCDAPVNCSGIKVQAYALT